MEWKCNGVHFIFLLLLLVQVLLLFLLFHFIFHVIVYFIFTAVAFARFVFCFLFFFCFWVLFFCAEQGEWPPRRHIGEHIGLSPLSIVCTRICCEQGLLSVVCFYSVSLRCVFDYYCTSMSDMGSGYTPTIVYMYGGYCLCIREP